VPDDSYSGGDSPYAWDWSAGAFAPPGVIWLGEIPLPVAQELVAQGGWDVIGQPLPSMPSMPSTSPPAPTSPPNLSLPPPSEPGAVSPPPSSGSDEGGPEEAAPPDFDVPLPSEPPPVQAPVEVPPPIEGELVGPDIVYHDYEGYDQLPGFGDIGDPPKRIIEGETQPPGALEQPPWWFGPVARRVGRVILGPYGSVAGQVIEATLPEVLGSGELPFPPIPRVDIPTPQVTRWPDLPPLPSPPEPALSLPPLPDVVVVTPTSPVYTPSPPRSSQTLPQIAKNPAIWGLLGGLAPILRPIHRGRARTSSPISQIANFPQPAEVNYPQPLPRANPDPLSPPWPTPGTDPLTPPRETPVTSTQTAPFGPLKMYAPTQTDEDERCRCKKNEKHEEDPSDVIANVKVYKRRMSNWSLKNLNRGTKAAKLLQRFI